MVLGFGWGSNGSGSSPESREARKEDKKEIVTAS